MVVCMSWPVVLARVMLKSMASDPSEYAGKKSRFCLLLEEVHELLRGQAHHHVQHVRRAERDVVRGVLRAHGLRSVCPLWTTNCRYAVSGTSMPK